MMREVVGRLRLRDPLIRLYHRVTCLANDRWSIAVTPAHFAEQMEVLRQRTKVLPLAALDAAPVNSTPRRDYRPLTPNELDSLSRDARIEIGAPTASHGRLAALTEASQRADIEAGRAALQSIIDQPIERRSRAFARRATIDGTYCWSRMACATAARRSRERTPRGNRIGFACGSMRSTRTSE